jgi:hypothetical protein
VVLLARSLNHVLIVRRFLLTFFVALSLPDGM